MEGGLGKERDLSGREEKRATERGGGVVVGEGNSPPESPVVGHSQASGF